MNDQTAETVQNALAEKANPRDVALLTRFFKTSEGEYGQGDVFIGVRVPTTRSVIKRFSTLSLAEIDRLLNSSVHEHRQAALFILVRRFLVASRPSTRDDHIRGELSNFYVGALKRGRV